MIQPICIIAKHGKERQNLPKKYKIINPVAKLEQSTYPSGLLKKVISAMTQVRHSVKWNKFKVRRHSHQYYNIICEALNTANK